MRFAVPHPIPYQGSKRKLASVVLSFAQTQRSSRLVEPFAGSAAVSLAAASRGQFGSFVIGDKLEPLAELWQMILDCPSEVADEYELWWGTERANPIAAFYDIREIFNQDRSPTKLLYLLARCVKNAVRFNPAGDFNQAPDKRRKGTHPRLMRDEIMVASRLLGGRCEVVGCDFYMLIESARKEDFVYLDPPYEGTSGGRDRRYFAGIDRERIIEALEPLNSRQIPFVLNYDGSCGGRAYGKPIPPDLARHLSVGVGRSSQSTLNGRSDETVESLYLSPLIPYEGLGTVIIDSFAPQRKLFA